MVNKLRNQRLVNVLLLVGTLVVLLALFIHPIDSDGDFFQHVNIGQYIVTHHALPRVDNLTFTAAGRPYIGYAWATGVLFYLTYHTFGAIGINILIISTAIVTCLLLYWYLHRCLKVSFQLSLLTILIVAPVMATRWPSRPEVFMYGIFLGFLLLDYYKKHFPKISLLYPVLVLLLVNLYGSSFPMAAGLLVLLIVKNIVDKDKSVWFYVSVFVSFPIALLNGYGLKSLFFFTLVSKMTFLWGDWVGLWEILRRPEINFTREIIVICCLFTVYVVGLVAFSFKKLKAYPWLVILACAVLVPYEAVRLRTLAAILCAPFIGVMLMQVRSRWLLIASFIIGAAMAALFIFINPPQLGESTRIFPPKLIQFIHDNNLTSNVFNTPRIGSFLSYNLAPSIRTFSDTRDELFIGTGVLEASQAFLSSQASISYLLHKYHVDIVIASVYDGNSFRDLVYDPGWALVYANDIYFVFIPRKMAITRHISILEGIDPYSSTGHKNGL